MKLPWKQISDVSWRYTVPFIGKKKGRVSPHKDDHIQLWFEATESEYIYTINIDGRRKFTPLQDKTWLALFFGSGPIRSNIKPHKLWSDKFLVLGRYGLSSRTYLAITKKRK
jgi:hypothetical protein